ncbi:MAG TPA: ATP-binding protein [Gemmatimonadaceae bacterium]|nr:ATP-binding protein [Gemmatimonadaceae bacterium]
MTHVITVPPSLDDHSFEQVLEQVAPLSPDEKILVDARHARWASPYGLTALLTLAQTRTERPALAVPELEDTASYWARAAFFQHAEGLYDMHGHYPKRPPAGESNVLLEVTPVTKGEDVHSVVGMVQERAQKIIKNELKLESKAIIGFAMTLSEVCQNIIEHAGQGGWVAVQSYRWTKRLGRRVVVIAVCDAGLGFRKSLESAPGHLPTSRWDDAAALEEAVIRGVSRFRDRSRGQGLAGARNYVGRWNGKLSVRSGTARISIVPSWDDDVPLAEGLAPFAGAQVQVIIPEAAAPESGDKASPRSARTER